MAQTTTGRVALFSIHPQYAEAILDGVKRVEFRRQGLPADVTRIVIYATSPVQRIVGFFQVQGIDKATPTQAWREHNSVGCIRRADFNSYYSGAKAAFVIHAQDPVRFESPVSLSDIDEHLRPPQSYIYLDESRMLRIAELATPPAGHPVRALVGALGGLASRAWAAAL